MQTGNKKKGNSTWITALSAFLLAAIVTASLSKDEEPATYFAGIMKD